MAKKAKTNRRYFEILGIILVIVILSAYLTTSKQSQLTTNPSPTSLIRSESYTSKFLKITINVPENYSVKEKFETITLSEKNGYGEIILSRGGTNYSSLDNYLADLNKKYNLRIIGSKKILINNSEAIKEKIGEETYYTIYANYWIFTIRTSSIALSSDLDKIAMSFRYTP